MAVCASLLLRVYIFATLCLFTCFCVSVCVLLTGFQCLWANFDTHSLPRVLYCFLQGEVTLHESTETILLTMKIHLIVIFPCIV